MSDQKINEAAGGAAAGGGGGGAAGDNTKTESTAAATNANTVHFVNDDQLPTLGKKSYELTSSKEYVRKHMFIKQQEELQGGALIVNEEELLEVLNDISATSTPPPAAGETSRVFRIPKKKSKKN